jgi:hypothetical protein
MRLKSRMDAMWFVAGLVFFGTQTVNAGFYAGTARVDISPSLEQIQKGEIRLGGHGLGSKATGIKDSIYARALFVSPSRGVREGVLFVSLDVPGVSNRLMDEVRDRVSRTIGIPSDRILIGATHTHQGPDLQGLWGGVVKNYRALLVDRIVGVAVEAYRKRTETQARVAETHAPNANRRGWGFTDDRMTVLDFVATENGERVGTLVNFAAHPVLGGKGDRRISRDFPGALVDRVEQSLGGVALYFNGATGDVSPIRPVGEGDATILYGVDLADRAVRALATSAESVESKPTHFAQTQWRNGVSNPIFFLAQLIGRTDYRMIMRPVLSLYVDTQGSFFEIGDRVSGVAFPGEALTRIGQRVLAKMSARYRLFLGLTGDTLGYFVPGDEWNSGRNNKYEEMISLGHGTGDDAVKNLAKILR